MIDITDIQIDDIKLFLRANKVQIDEDYIYDDAWDLIQEGVKYYPNSVINWMTAYNVFHSNVLIPEYTKSEILSLQQNDLTKLSKLFKTSSIDDIIDILKYLHKLVPENNLPVELFGEMIIRMDYSDIQNFCSSSKQIRKLCQSKNIKDTLVAKFSKDSLNTYDFNEEELEIYEKTKHLKRRMSLTKNINNDNVLNILYNDVEFVLNIKKDLLINNKSDINQILNYGQKKLDDTNIILTNDGIVNLYDVKNKTMSTLPINSQVIYCGANIRGLPSFYMITNNNEYYVKEYSLFKIVTPFNIIKNNDRIYLTDEGEIYVPHYNIDDPNINFDEIGMKYIMINGIPKTYDFVNNQLTVGNQYNTEIRFHKIKGLPKIKDITDGSKAISFDGTVYHISIPLFGLIKVKLLKKYINIIQIYETKDYVIFLDNEGNIIIDNHYGDNKLQIKTLKNIIEIIADDRFIYALDGQMCLYKYDILMSSIKEMPILVKTYNFLNLD